MFVKLWRHFVAKIVQLHQVEALCLHRQRNHHPHPIGHCKCHFPITFLCLRPSSNMIFQALTSPHPNLIHPTIFGDGNFHVGIAVAITSKKKHAEKQLRSVFSVRTHYSPTPSPPSASAKDAERAIPLWIYFCKDCAPAFPIVAGQIGAPPLHNFLQQCVAHMDGWCLSMRFDLSF